MFALIVEEQASLEHRKTLDRLVSCNHARILVRTDAYEFGR
jgi:hypothetical protein